MTVLLDTGVWIRAALDPESVPESERRILADPAATFGLSAYSLWEVAKKVQKGKLNLPFEVESWFDRVLGNVQLLPLSPRVVSEAMRLPDFPNRDPGDELIVATARVHDLKLLTTDTQLKGYRHAKIRYFTPILSPR